MTTKIQSQRREFSIKNNLLSLVGKTLSEKEMIKTLELVGIETFMCVDMDNKNDFLELSGLLITGKQNNEINEMEFVMKEI